MNWSTPLFRPKDSGKCDTNTILITTSTGRGEDVHIMVSAERIEFGYRVTHSSTDREGSPSSVRTESTPKYIAVESFTNASQTQLRHPFRRRTTVCAVGQSPCLVTHRHGVGSVLATQRSSSLTQSRHGLRAADMAWRLVTRRNWFYSPCRVTHRHGVGSLATTQQSSSLTRRVE